MRLLLLLRKSQGAIFTTLCILLNTSVISTFAQSASFWQDVNSGIVQSYGTRYSTPTDYRSLQLNVSSMRAHLQTAPKEFSESARTKSLVLSLPMPGGTIDDFEIFESPVMAPELAAKYP
ncbi:MAG: hypothetical protein ABI729_08160, partial [Chitinophagales bacterium]